MKKGADLWHRVLILQEVHTERFLHHKSFTDNASVDFVSLRFANVVLSHSRSLDGVQHTRFVITGNKVSNKVVVVVRRRFKTNDDAVFV